MSEENKPSPLAAGPDLEALQFAVDFLKDEGSKYPKMFQDIQKAEEAMKTLRALPSPAAPLEALRKVEELLTNLQPHIPQACYPKHAVFIDNYVNPALEICRVALSPSSTAPSGSGRKCWVMWSTLENRPVGICTEPESKYTRFPALNMEAVPMVEAPGEKGTEEGK